MVQLFSPFQIRNTTFKNRLVVSPMCMYSSENGYASDFHLVHLGSRAMGGFGLIIQEATAISPEGRITNGDLGIWENGHIEKLKEVVSFCQKHGSLVGIQLAHAGRKASCVPPFEGRHQIDPEKENGWQTVGPSKIAYKENQIPPTALDKNGIEKIKNDFVSATKKAKEIGYDVLEIHMAHGYLLHQFYSPISNHRTDEYGGSFENRIRFPLEIAEMVKQEWGNEKPLFVRVSATDWNRDGWTIEDSVKFCKKLKDLGVDLIDVSSGGNIFAEIPNTPGYQVGFSEIIRKEVGISTGAVGKITTARQAEEILQKEMADLIFLAREALRDPNFPLHAARKLAVDLDWSKQYERAKLSI